MRCLEARKYLSANTPATVHSRALCHSAHTANASCRQPSSRPCYAFTWTRLSLFVITHNFRQNVLVQSITTLVMNIISRGPLALFLIQIRSQEVKVSQNQDHLKSTKEKQKYLVMLWACWRYFSSRSRRAAYGGTRISVTGQRNTLRRFQCKLGKNNIKSAANVPACPSSRQ